EREPDLVHRRPRDLRGPHGLRLLAPPPRRQRRRDADRALDLPRRLQRVPVLPPDPGGREQQIASAEAGAYPAPASASSPETELEQPAHPWGGGPGGEAPLLHGAGGGVHLLLLGPVVRRPLRLVDGGGVRLLELAVHLEAAVVAVAGRDVPAAAGLVLGDAGQLVVVGDALGHRPLLLGQPLGRLPEPARAGGPAGEPLAPPRGAGGRCERLGLLEPQAERQARRAAVLVGG